MKNIDIMRDWYATAKKISGQDATVTAANIAEFYELYDCAEKAKKANIAVRTGGTGNIRQNGFHVRFNGGTFKINPPSTHKKGVAATSREAYHSLNIPESVQVVAKAAIELVAKKGYCTDVELANYMGMQPAIISARRNDIEKLGAVKIGDETYTLESMGTKLNPSGKSARAWRLVAENKAMELF